MTSSHHRSLYGSGNRRAFLRGLVLAALLLGAAIATPARADMISDWTARAEAIALAKAQSPRARTQTLALLHGAMCEAMTIAERGDTPNRLDLSVDGDVSVDAAAVAAAHAVLISLYPDQMADLAAPYAASLSRIPNDVPKVRGFLLGKTVAERVLALWFAPAAGKQDVARQGGGSSVESP